MKNNCKRRRLLKPLISVTMIISMALITAILGDIIGGPFAPAQVHASPLDGILNDVLEETGLKSAADKLSSFMGEGRLEALQKAFQSVTGGNVAVAGGETTEEISEIMKILQDLSATGNIGVSMLRAVPFNFSVEVDLPKLKVNGTDILEVRAWAEKTDMGYVSACIRLDGPGGSQAVVGFGNDNPLGRGNAQHFENEMYIPYAFLDITRNGKSYVHLRIPLIGGLPVFKAEEYLPYYDNKYVQVKIGAMDETSVELEFEISLKATVDAGVSLEGEAKASLSVEVSQAVAGKLLKLMTSNLAKSAQSISQKYKYRNPTPEEATDDAATLLYSAISCLYGFSQRDREALGEIELSFGLSGDVGLGALDTKWAGVSASADMSYSLTSGALSKITKDMLVDLVEFAPEMANDMKRLVDGWLNSRLNYGGLVDVWNNGGCRDFTNSFFESLGEEAVGIEISASLDLAGESDSSDSEDTDTVNLLSATLSIPEASIQDTPDFIAESLQAVSATLAGLLQYTGLEGWIPQGVNPLQVDESLVNNMLEDASLSLSTTLAPPIQFSAEFPVKPFLRALLLAPETILNYMTEAAYQGKLEPIETMWNELQVLGSEALTGLRNSTFGISIGAGANADLGAEAKISLSAGIDISAQTNVEMLLFLIGLDDPDIDGSAGFKATVNAGAGVGLSLGEAVEVGAEGGITINQNLLSLEFNEVTGPPPQLYWNYDSSNTSLITLAVVPPNGVPFEMTPEFGQGNTVYNVWIPYNRFGQIFYLNLAKAHPGQSIHVQEDKNSKQEYDPNEDYFIADTSVKKQFKIFVQSGNKKATRQYTVNVQMEHSDRLERLELWEDRGKDGKVDIMQGNFDPYMTFYSLNVGEYTEFLDIRMTKEDAKGAKLKVNGMEWDHNNAYRMYLTPGNNYVDISLSAEDVREPGADTVRTYRLEVFRAFSSNAKLSYLTVSKGGGADGEEPFEYDLSRSTFEQIVNVGSEVESVVIRFSTEENDTTVWRWYFGDIQMKPDSVDGEESPIYTYKIRLSPGENTFMIKTRAPDGVHIELYHIKIYREIPDYTDNPEFISLSLDYIDYDTYEEGNAGELENPGEGVYFFNFPEGVINAFVDAAIKTGRVASMEILGSASENFGLTGKDYNTVWNLYSKQPLYVGQSYTVPIEVTTEGGKKALYLLILNGKGHNLSDYPRLEITDSSGQQLQLKPSFDRNITEYELTVPTGTEYLNVLGWNGNNGGYVTINDKVTQFPDFRDGKIVRDPVTVYLEQGMNLIDMVVGNLDGSNKIYTVIVKREYLPERNPEAKSIVLSSDGSFASRMLNTSKRKHTFDIKNDVDEITVTITPETSASAVINFRSGGESLTVNGYTGAFPLKVGENIIDITMISEDGKLKQNYTIILNRMPSSDATLSLLTLNGVEVPNIKGVFSYNMYFSNDTESVTLVAMPSVTSDAGGAGARVAINGIPYENGEPMEIALEEGSNDIKILVTAEDNRTTRVMYIFATRMGPPDTTPPNIALEDITVEATSAEGAYVTFWVKAYDEVDGYVPVYCEPYAGSLFPIGETIVTVTATDKSGNTATGSFKVIVQDTTPPVITGPSEILVPVDESGKEGTAYFEGFSAYDAVDGPVEVLVTFESGSKFPLGTTKVTCVAEDSRGNIAIKTIDVIVTDRVGVASSNPVKNRNDVNPESSITLVFNKSVHLTDAASGINVKENGSVIESTYSLSSDGMTLTIIPAEGLRYGKLYTVTLPEGVAADAEDPDMRSLSFTLSFRTVEAPPLAAETDTKGRTIILTFEKPLSDVAGKQAQFKAFVNGTERSIRAALLGANKKQIIFELEGPVLASSDIVTVSYTPGDLRTMDGGIFIAFSEIEVENKTTFDGGTGSENDPYLISNAAQLDAIRNDLGAHYRLKADIDLSSYDTGYGSLGWMPIGDASNPFTGTLDGNGHFISGLHIERLTTDNVGLFGFISSGTIKNISLTNVDVGGRHNVGALAGTDLGNGIRTSIHVTGQVSAAYAIGGINVGGIFGVSYSDISESSFEGSAWGNENVGGITGMLINSSISESYTNVDVRGYKNTGGLIGQLFGSDQEVSIVNCYSAGLLIGGNSFSPDPVGCGGLVGFIDGSAEITNSFASVEINVNNERRSLIGGLIGNNESAGIAVSNSFYNSSLYTFDNSVFYGTPLTTLEMKSADEFVNAGWDFESVWAISEGTYPYLQKFGVKDFAPPIILSTSPADGEKNFSILKNLTVTYDEPLKYYRDGLNVKEIIDPASLVELRTSMDIVEITASLSQDKKVLTITPTGGLNPYLAYSFSIKPVGDANKNLIPRTDVSFITGSPPIESIIVKAGWEDVDTLIVGSIIQMHLQIIPANAGDVPIIWTVEPGTGSATIDQYGYLICTGAGTVTVIATADDGSGISGSKVITIKERPEFKSVTIYPEDIPEGMDATIKVTVVTKNVDDGTVITSRLQDNSTGEIVEGTLVTATVTDNIAELYLTVTDAVLGEYTVYTTMDFLGYQNWLQSYNSFKVKKTEKLPVPGNVRISLDVLHWDPVPNAGSYIITITPDGSAGGEPTTYTKQATDGTSFNLPPLPVTDVRNGTTYYVTVTAVPYENDMYHVASDTSDPAPFIVRLKSLVVAVPPTKYIYYLGDNIDLTGLVVKGITTDNQEIVLSDISEADIFGFNIDVPGKQDIGITYGGVTLSSAFEVLVLGVAGLEVSQCPYKDEYYLGEELDLTGLVVNAIYSNGSKREIPIEELEITGFDSSSEGSKTITVSYKGCQTYFYVYVDSIDAELDPEIKIIDINAPPSDINVHITWNDATEVTTIEMEYFDNEEFEWKSSTLIQGIDYTVEDDVLTIKADLYEGLTEYDSYYFWIGFNVGIGRWLEVRGIDGNKAYDATLKSLYVGFDWGIYEYTPLQGFDTEIYEYYVLVPEGTSPYDSPTWVYGEANDEYADVSYFDAEEIPGSTTLTVTSWDLKTTKTYVVNFVTSPGQLPVFITMHPVSRTVSAGQSVTFKVEATGAEPLSYKWMKDGTEINDDENINGSDTAELTIISARESDAGSYTVTVTNELASVTSKAAVLTVNPVLPVNTAPNRKAGIPATASESVTVNNAYILDLSTIFEDADGDELTYKVSVNGAEYVAASKDYSYTPTSTGTITLIFKANDGMEDSTDTYTVTLTVNPAPVAPSITTQPISQTVTEGDTATFTVEATGTEPLSYKWMKNGIELIDDENISGAKTNTLIINTVQLSDAGSYTVVVTNAVSSVTSEAAVLTVNPAPPVNTAPNRKAGIPATATATVAVNNAYTLDLSTIFEDADGDELTYKVSINGVEYVAASKDYSYTPTVTGTITLVFKANDGTEDSTDTYTVTLIVNPAPVAPSITTQPISQTVTEGDTVTFTVEATGTEPLSYKWMKNGIELSNKENISGVNSNTLTIKTVQLSDAGSYTVVVTNAVSSVTSEAAVLTVNPAPPMNTAPNRKAGVPATRTVAVTVNNAYILDLSTIFEDADGDQLTYRVSINGAEYIDANESYSYTPTVTGTITLVFKANDGTEDSTDTYTVTLKVSNSGSGAGGGFGGIIIGESDYTQDTPTYNANVSGIDKTEITLPVTVNTDMGNAAVELEDTVINDIFTGTGMTVLTVPSIPDVNSYTLGIPADFLSGSQQKDALTFSTDVGSITIPSDMLSGLPEIEGKKASITIGHGDKSGLPEDVKAAIGDRPIVQLTLTLDSVQIEWNNPDAPVTVSIPYTPTAEELADPEHIVIWYIDGSGNIISVPNGRYDPETGTVTFTTTHFSHYAVAYVHKTFSDLGSVEWARRPVEVLASKGIINGTSKDTYSPVSNITRADYLVLLVKTLGLTASFDSNFDDMRPGTYYYEAVGIAKKLGITTGVGNNRFNPMEYISRQDMMVLTARALEKYKGLKAAKDTTALNKFIDKEDIAEYAIGSTATLVKEGLIAGSGDKLNPKAFTTRAEAAVILYRIYNKYAAN
ncbi:MAG TPA: HYR domain-containing protein [Clostridiaceae bacterium]|nr:HYR domain-containing protein [Clostridiaceae bacterium]